MFYLFKEIHSIAITVYNIHVHSIMINIFYTFIFFNNMKIISYYHDTHDIIASISYSDEKVSSRVLNNEPSPIQKNSQNKISYLENQNITLHKVLIILFELLQEYLSFNNINEIISLHNQTSAIMDPSTDANNNNLAVETIRDIKLNNHITDSKESFVYDDHVTACNNNYIMNTSNLYSESAKRSDCSCNRGQSNCIDAKSYSCVNCTSQSTVICTDIKSIYKKKSVATSNSMKDCSSMKDTFSKSFPVINENCRKSLYRDITNDFCVSDFCDNAV